MRHSFLAVTAAALALSGCVAAVPVAPTPVPTAPIVVAQTTVERSRPRCSGVARSVAA